LVRVISLGIELGTPWQRVRHVEQLNTMLVSGNV